MGDDVDLRSFPLDALPLGLTLVTSKSRDIRGRLVHEIVALAAQEFGSAVLLHRPGAQFGRRLAESRRFASWSHVTTLHVEGRSMIYEDQMAGIVDAYPSNVIAIDPVGIVLSPKGADLEERGGLLAHRLNEIGDETGTSFVIASDYIVTGARAHLHTAVERFGTVVTVMAPEIDPWSVRFSGLEMIHCDVDGKATVTALEVVRPRKPVIRSAHRREYMENREHLLAVVTERDGAYCRRCGITYGLSLDHIIPLDAGGTNDLENLGILCRWHNAQKARRTGDDVIRSFYRRDHS